MSPGEDLVADTPAADGGDVEPGVMVDAIVHECATQLGALARDPGFATAIDLRSLPLDDAQRQMLRARLGQGEVRAVVDVAGPTTVDETAFAGLWWVRHEGADGGVLAEQIVVARVPELLLAHPADVAVAAVRLRDALDAFGALDAAAPDNTMEHGDG
ncbi:MAG: hydrogenase expression/formation protein [Burkholderiaceae bacterium]|jgi:hydrogenase-1 operon protein HyaF|nr:hydrogenase expression/formation protein [Burkholderiaceae bacterium]